MTPALRPHHLVILSAFGLVACTIGEERFEIVKIPARTSTEIRTCKPPFAKPDLGKLKPCGDGKGKGHCYPATKVATPAKEFIECEGGEVCVPDKLLASGGKKATACKWTKGGDPGGCISMLMKRVNENQAALLQDACDPDERCGPCIDPTTNEESGACAETGVYENDCTGGTKENKQVECCGGFGLCTNTSAIPEDSRGHMERQGCPGSQVCAPASLIDGSPTKCSALGISGVCVALCFASMLQSTSQVMRGDCQAHEICLPCVVGKSQGMPGCD